MAESEVRKDAEYARKLGRDIELGEKIRDFLKSEAWGLIKAYIDDSLKGLNNIRDIDISSEKKTQSEIIGRKYAADYLEAIPRYLETLVQQGEFSLNELERIKKGQSYIIRK